MRESRVEVRVRREVGSVGGSSVGTGVVEEDASVAIDGVRIRWGDSCGLCVF